MEGARRTGAGAGKGVAMGRGTTERGELIEYTQN
jgi:hypothetical protein